MARTMNTYTHTYIRHAVFSTFSRKNAKNSPNLRSEYMLYIQLFILSHVNCKVVYSLPLMDFESRKPVTFLNRFEVNDPKPKDYHH